MLKSTTAAGLCSELTVPLHKVTTLNDVRVYDLASSKLKPDFGKVSKSTWDSFRHRVDLLQGFEFPTSSSSLRMTRDGLHIAAVGTYPPQVKMFDLQDLTEKFERHMDAEVVQFEVLSEDYTKLAFLMADRTLEFHAGFGRLHRLRIPRFGRGLAYHGPTAELLVVGDSSDIWRVNLADGQFMKPWESKSPAINAIDVAPGTQLVCVGGEDGAVEVWDPRTREAASRLDLPLARGSAADADGSPVTALRFDETGLYLAAGTEDARCMVFDLRSATPVQTKNHQYGLPIKCLRFHQGPASVSSSGSSKLVVSADAKIVKIWEKDSGKLLTNIEPSAPINDVMLAPVHRPSPVTLASWSPLPPPDSGLIFLAGEQSRVMQYFVPQLGIAPKWGAFIDSITEELEENQATADAAGKARAATVYEDYKFVTREELSRLGVAHLIGTPLLKAYMHGFFMDIKLYSQMQAVADPYAFDRHRKEKVRAKIEAQRGSRINITRRLPTVNADLAQRLMDGKTMGVTTEERQKRKDAKKKNNKRKARDEEEEEEEGEGAGTAAADGPLIDDRFAKLFSDPDFEIEPIKKRL